MISIILPIYNGEKTLKSTLESLFKQTFQDFEIVACIDGTNDASEQILLDQKDPRIRILKNNINLGLGRTLNRLIANCSPQSEYIAMAEQDDWYFPYRLKMQVDVLDQHPEVGLVTGIAEHKNGKKSTLFPGLLAKGRSFPTDPVQMFKLNFREQIKVVQTCMMFRKSVHQNYGLYFTQHFPTLSIDWLYILRFSLISQIKGLNTPLVIVDRRTLRTSATTNKIKMYVTARELLRSSYWEFKHILTKDDLKYAMNTEYFLEGKQQNINIYFLRLLNVLLNDPFDKRLIPYIMHLKHRFKMNYNKRSNMLAKSIEPA